MSIKNKIKQPNIQNLSTGIKFKDFKIENVSNDNKKEYVKIPKLIEEYNRIISDRNNINSEKYIKRAKEIVEDYVRILNAPSIPEKPTAYTFEGVKTPGKAVKRYKAFTMVNGNLRALYVGATENLPVGKWLGATAGGFYIETKEVTKKVKGKIVIEPSTKYVIGGTGTSMSLSRFTEDSIKKLKERGFLKKDKNGKEPKNIKVLAYRPGWHTGTLPYNPQGAGTKDPYYSKGNERSDRHPYPHILFRKTVIAEVLLAADINYQAEYEKEAKKTKDGSIDVKKSGLRKVPENGYYNYTTNSTIDNEPGDWSIGGALKILRILTPEECDAIMRSHGLSPQKRILEGADFKELGLINKEEHVFDEKRITTAFYEENGKILTLQERFGDLSRNEEIERNIKEPTIEQIRKYIEGQAEDIMAISRLSAKEQKSLGIDWIMNLISDLKRRNTNSKGKVNIKKVFKRPFDFGQLIKEVRDRFSDEEKVEIIRETAVRYHKANKPGSESVAYKIKYVDGKELNNLPNDIKEAFKKKSDKIKIENNVIVYSKENIELLKNSGIVKNLGKITSFDEEKEIKLALTTRYKKPTEKSTSKGKLPEVSDTEQLPDDFNAEEHNGFNGEVENILIENEIDYIRKGRTFLLNDQPNYLKGITIFNNKFYLHGSGGFKSHPILEFSIANSNVKKNLLKTLLSLVKLIGLRYRKKHIDNFEEYFNNLDISENNKNHIEMVAEGDKSLLVKNNIQYFPSGDPKVDSRMLTYLLQGFSSGIDLKVLSYNKSFGNRFQYMASKLKFH